MPKRIYTTFCLIVLFICTHCTKKVDRWIDQEADTIYDTLTTLPGNRILSFKIANITQDNIYSAVDDSSKTITTYLPWYYTLHFIEPEITLSKDATIKPASGELVDVFSTTPMVYTVTGKDGRTMQYTLRVVVQQPQLALNELSTATTTAQFNTSSNAITLTGKNFIPDVNVTKVYLIGQNNARWLLATYNSGTERSDNIAFVPPGITYKDNPPPPGLYYVEMQAYSLQARMQYPIQLN
jgi:hypothetical protein